MKNLLALSLVACSTFVMAQQPEVINKEKMKVLDAWTGHWLGESEAMNAEGQMMKASVDERIESKLDGTILLVEGIGTITKPGAEKFVVHHALGIISFDQRTNEYKFKTYLANGRSGDAWFKIISDNKYQWGFDAPSFRMRYNITLDPVQKTWHEVGESSADGTTWKKTIEMNLKRAD